ncbi:MAG TPA: DUF3466 family protein [Burkholderiales bacterium]|nr:DUF3466 family protein [Burkholderiales bacterium]
MNIYSVVDLGTLSGDRPEARAINNAGVVVGRFAHRAMRYDGSLHALPSPVVATPVGEGVAERYEACGINNGKPELIVGFREANNFRYAVMWIDGVYVDLHAILNTGTSEAHDVNDAGVVVGRAGGRAFRFNTKSGPDQPKFVQYLTADNVSSCAKAINAQGHVVGWLDTYVQGSPYTVCFLYDGTINQLTNIYGEPLRVLQDDPLDINDADIVVGHEVPSHYAFQYDHDTKASIAISPPYTAAWAINKYNHVVGTNWGGAEQAGYSGVSWPAGEPMQTLTKWVYPLPNGFSITDAVAINAKSQIAVTGKYGVDLPRSFLLKPVYERRQDQNPFDDLEWLVQVILLGGGGLGLLAPGGRLIYPKGPPVDPAGPFRRLDPAQRDVLVGLAVQVIARNISDPEARRIAEAGGLQAIRKAVERLISALGHDSGA